MQHPIFTLFVAVPLIGACGATIPPPTQRLADAESVQRSALEVGANNVPAAQLSLKNTQDQIAQAQRAMADGDNVRAEALLIRAKADGELALAQAREKTASVGHQEAVTDSADQKATNVGQGAVK